MTTSYRRYEVLIPSRYNSGAPVPEILFAESLLELRKRFGAVSAETQIIRGQWEHRGEVFKDENFRLFLDVVDTNENREFFSQFKGVLKQRVERIDIWITSYPVEVI